MKGDIIMWDGVLRGMDAVEHNMHEKECRDHEGKLQELRQTKEHLEEENKSYQKEIQELQDEINRLKENKQIDKIDISDYTEEPINDIYRKIAFNIMDSFEDFLDEHDITIPCESESDEEDRAEDGANARIYGSEYYYLEDSVYEKIKYTITHFIRKYTKKQNNSLSERK